MGGCFSIRFYGFGSFGGFNRSDINGSTFSHYSLNSDNSFLDLYPTLKYMEYETETEASSMVSVTQGICHFKNWNSNELATSSSSNEKTSQTNQLILETWSEDDSQQN